MKKNKNKRGIVGDGEKLTIPMPLMDTGREVAGDQFSLSDTLTLQSPRMTRDGYMLVDIFAARTGIQNYSGAELGLIDADVVAVYRPEDEVFDRDSLSTFAHRPVTNDHPPVLVDASNYSEYANGFTGSDITRVDDKVNMQAVIGDKVLIDAIQAGKRELSAGYTCNIEFVKGVTKDGVVYDAIQRNVIVNHVAVVDAGRAGHNCRIGDATKDEKLMPTPNLKTVTFDGLTIETTDQGAEVIAKQAKMLDDANAEITRLTTDHATEIAAKDKELGEKEADLQKLKDSELTPEAIDKLVADRAAVTDSVKKLGVTVDTKGKTPAEIRRAAVAAKLGDAAVTNKSDDYVEALFDRSSAEAPDAFRSALIADGAGNDSNPQGQDTEYNKMLADQRDAWRGKES